MTILTCKQYHSKVADWLAGRLDAQEQNAMRIHCAACVSCARLKHEESAVRGAWRDLVAVTENAPPDLMTRLAARLDAAPSKRASFLPRLPKSKAFNTLFPVAAIMGGIVLFARLQSATNIRYENAVNPQHFTAKSFANSNKAESPSLDVMLTAVRWQSSDERKLHSDPLYNEEARRLLLSEKGSTQ